jgi:hypothetical protein
VIVHDLDILGARGRPAKADTELIVNADAMLARAISLQGFEPVSRWYAQVV